METPDHKVASDNNQRHLNTNDEGKEENNSHTSEVTEDHQEEEGVEEDGNRHDFDDTDVNSNDAEKEEGEDESPHGLYVSPDAIIGKWRSGKLLETMRTFKRELNWDIPKWVSIKLDKWKEDLEIVTGRNYKAHEFHALLVGAVLGATWIYITCVPWRYRLFVGLIIVVWTKSGWAAIATGVTTLLTIFNKTNCIKVDESKSEIWALGGTLAVFASLSGYLSESSELGQYFS